MSNEDGGCRAGEAGDGMVLGEPEAGVAKGLDGLGELDGAGDGGGGGFAGMETYEIQNGDRE